MKMRILTVVLGWLMCVPLAVSLWAADGSPEKVVQIGELPAVAQQTLKDRVKDATIEKIVQVPSYFVIKALVSGETHVLTVSGDGKAAEGPARLRQGDNIEGPTVPWAEVPKAVRDMLAKKLPGAGVQEVARGPWLYRASLKLADRTFAVTVDEKGRQVPLHISHERTESDRQRMQEMQHREQAIRDGEFNRGGGAPAHRESDAPAHRPAGAPIPHESDR